MNNCNKENHNGNRVVINGVKLTGILLLMLFASKLMYAQWFIETSAGYMLPRNMGYNPVYSNITTEYNIYITEDPQITEEIPFTANLSNIKTNIGIRYYFTNQEK